MLHGQFMVEVLIFHPEGIDTAHEQNSYRSLSQPVIEFFPSSLFLLPSSLFLAVRQSKDDEKECQQIIGDIIGGMILCDVEQRQFRPEYIGQVDLVVDVSVANQRYGSDTQDGYHTTDDCLGATGRQPP